LVNSSLHTQPTFAGLGVPFQESIDHSVEFHETLIFPKIIFGLTQQTINMAVRTPDAKFTGFLKGVEDQDII